jgi:hypothetical protein
MDEPPSTHQAVDAIAAVRHTVDAGKISRLVATLRSDGGRMLGGGLGVLEPLRHRCMGKDQETVRGQPNAVRRCAPWH